MAGQVRWSALVPLPDPVPLTTGYDRHHATDEAVRAELAQVVRTRPWAELAWPALLDALLAVGRADVPLSRLVEGHVDALRILRQADVDPQGDALYGVWASRSQQTGVTATRHGAELVLDGTVRFASGTGVLDRALLPVWPEPDQHLLLDLAVRDGGAPDLGGTVEVDRSGWVTGAMEVSRSHTYQFRGHSVSTTDQVGPDDFYLRRSGFFPGGVGVAACWLGGAIRVADLVHNRLRAPASPAVQQRLGILRSRLATGAAVLATAGRRLADPGTAVAALGQLIASETRSAVAEVVHDVLDQAHRVAGPAGLAYDLDLTRAVHDLRLYVLQHSADGDAAYLGGVDLT